MLASQQSVLILLPVYNESFVIVSILESIQKEGWKHILVVDDGSTDGTYEGACSVSGVRVVRHSINRGKGAAMKTGLEAAKRLGAAIVVTLDGDGQHDPADIKKLVSQVQKGNDVVLGYRDFSKLHIPRYKAYTNYLGNIITWILYGLWVKDSQSGFRAFSSKALDCIQTNSDRYEFESEIVREIVRHNLKWTETEIAVRYSPYDQQKKNKQTFIGAVKTVFRLLFIE